MQQETILWYDLETFGTNPQHDRVAQYAAIRTDRNLREIGEPVIRYCRITDDYLPDPQACLVTRITPQDVMEKGLPEYRFIDEINRDMSHPRTCAAGYNSIRFDDEFIRNLLYRNFFDPYEREYAGGNSRWDLIDVVRAAHDLRPEGISWPRNDEGRPSFRLEDLTRANGIAHEDAHDALADVRATIAVARLLWEKKPDLYGYAYEIRQKNTLRNRIDIFHLKPILHTSSIYTTEYGCTAVILPIIVDPDNSNAIIGYDLSRDPEPLLGAAPEQLFTPEVPLSRIALNRAPFIAPIGTLTEEAAERLHIDMPTCREHYKRITDRKDISRKLRFALEERSSPAPQQFNDPDFQIYSGGFFTDNDRDRFQIIRNTPPGELLDLHLHFDDPRIPEMLWRYTARNFPEVLDEQQRERWISFAAGRVLFPPGNSVVNLEFFRRKIRERIISNETSAADKALLRRLADYGNALEQRLFSSRPATKR